MLKSMVGPPLTMLLIADGLLSVQQEIEAGILMPSVLEEKTPNKKQKYEHEVGQIKRNSSKEGESSQIIVAIVEPEMCKNVLINTTRNDTSNFKQATLKNIHQKFSQANQLLKN